MQSAEAAERRRAANREYMRRSRAAGGDRESAARYREAHKEELRARQAAWKRDNPSACKLHRRKYRLKIEYRLTLEEWDAMFACQGSVCAICGTSDPGTKAGWHTDHDHTTGAVRGILCHGCNATLGGAKDNPETLERAADYLRRRA